MKRIIPLLSLALIAVILAGCGGSHHKTPTPTPPPASSCPQAADGHGALGGCAPKQKLGLTAPHPKSTAGQSIFQDRSNNDPCYCGASIRAAGQVGLIVKANQGTGFIDSTEIGMIASARAAGLAVGVYDFDQDYSIAEARVFVARAQAAGIYPHTPNTFPLYLDVEFGNFSYTGLVAQIAYLRSLGYRVGIYSGAWYWSPHAGCRWPAGLSSAWLSGYPIAPVPCGTTGYNAHQFTSTPIDLTAFLGSRAQFAAFVQATPPKPPGPTAAQIKHRTGARDASLRVYHRHHCTMPVLGPKDCHDLARSVVYWQTQLPGKRPVCFGRHATPNAAVCQIVRPEATTQDRAAATSYTVARRKGCYGPSGQTPQGGPVCSPLFGRAHYFTKRAQQTRKAWS